MRKALGKYEIATVQTTAIDQEVGLIRLTTVLAHSSGEWVSSDWLVCPVSDTAAPHKMGAALTYARRYSLFTLVGIAGEDDLDAPDLPNVHLDGSSYAEKMNGGAQAAAVAAGGPKNRGRRKFTRNLDRTELPPDQSTALRERLLGEITALQSTHKATRWAQEGIITKNGLAAADARLVEEAFAVRLSSLSDAEPGEAVSVAICAESHATPPELAGLAVQRTDGPVVIDKSVLTIAEPRRYRNKEHLRFVAQQACLVCGRKPSDPHHLRFMQPRALGSKVSDEFVAPLCQSIIGRFIVPAMNGHGGKQAGIDAVEVARNLWRNSRRNETSPRTKTEPAGVDAALNAGDPAPK